VTRLKIIFLLVYFYNFIFLMNFLVDESCAVDVCVWDGACGEYYSAILLDDIVCITGYRIHKRNNYALGEVKK
jgi:hypothetical protein